MNVIGAHGVNLVGKFLSPTLDHLPCEGKASSECAFTRADSDTWVDLAFQATGSTDHVQCQVGSHTVCQWASKSPASESSCSFLVPQGASLQCTGTHTVTSAVTQILSQNLGPVGSPKQSTCPPENSDPTLCDCTYANTEKVDLFVSISAGNGDDVFNSFHCYTWGVNVCAWGANNGEKDWMGHCNFILPAGSEYSCEMEWGATAFPAVSVWPLSGSMFPNQFGLNVSRLPASGAPHVPSTRSETDLFRLFAEFEMHHGEVTGNKSEKFVNFRRYVALVDSHPSNKPLVSGAELSSLALLSATEFEDAYCGCAKVEPVEHRWSGLTNEDILATPAEVDWRDHGAVTPVKDQGQCGSCWSFSTTGALEGAWAVAGHGLESLSEQHLVSCDNSDGNAGCGGGWPYKAIDYVKSHGIDTEASYPYNSGGGTAPSCASSSGTKAAITVSGHTTLEQDEEIMAAWVAKYGPLSVSIDAMTQLWWPYTGGIMTGCCNTEVDHAVLVVGFGEENGQKYWLIKNSWSESWGEQGYIRLERGTNQCGITYAAVGALVSGSPSPPTPTPAPPTPPTPTPVPPTPTPSTCPTDAQLVSSGGNMECLWTSGTAGLVIPSSARQYCDYIADGYFGYTFQSSEGDFGCSPTARKSSNGGTIFCVWEDGAKDVHIPAGSSADCDSLSDGRIGFLLPSIEMV